MKTPSRLLVAAAVCVAAISVQATEVRITPSGVRYLTGGVTAQELAAVQAARRDFSLALRPVSEISGGPLIDAQIRIRRADGSELLVAEMDGPWFLAALPPGRYRVEVTFQDETQQIAVEIPREGQRELVLRFRSDAEVSALARR
jgi:hypothetical protein